MKLSTRARYALRMMLEIAKHPEKTPVNLQIISDNTRISRRYLEQLAATLKGANLIRGIPGRDGGYQLTQSANLITIGKIIEAAIGPMNVVHCVKQPESCDISADCECRSIYRLINDRISQVLDEINLAELADHEKLENVVASLSVVQSHG